MQERLDNLINWESGHKFWQLLIFPNILLLTLLEFPCNIGNIPSNRPCPPSLAMNLWEIPIYGNSKNSFRGRTYNQTQFFSADYTSKSKHNSEKKCSRSAALFLLLRNKTSKKIMPWNNCWWASNNCFNSCWLLQIHM